jgi:ABC-type glycerol-3-phosphate transport system substrate-binding protein
MSTHNLQYRKDLFDKKGLKEPRTWDDLLRAAKTLTEDTDGDGKIDRYGIAMPLKNEYSTGVHFLGFLWGNGGHVLDRNGKVVFNSPETIQTLSFLKELYKYAPPGVTGYSWMELAATYATDKVAITTYSNLKPLADAIRANEMIAANTAVCAIPTRLSSQIPKARCAPMKWILFKGCKNPELAKDFLTFWFEPKRLVRWYHAEPIFLAPAEKAVIESKEYWEDPLLKKYKNAVEKLIALNETAVDPNMEHPGVLQPNTGIITQRLIITECLQEVVLGKYSPEEAAAKAHKRMEELVSKPK